MRLLLIRHAQSQGNLESRLQGRREFPLTERGVEQAQALASRLASAQIAAIYTSPLRRAMDTAHVVAEQLGLSTIADPRLQEYDFGDVVSGLTWQEIRERRPEILVALTGNGSDFPHYPGEEGRGAFHGRVCSALHEIAVRHRDEAVAVVTHAGPIIVFLMEVLGREYRRPIPFAIDNGSITTVEVNHEALPSLPQLVIAGINDACHLRHVTSHDRSTGSA